MSAFLEGIAIEIIGSLIDKAGTFVAGQAGNRIDWKVWKSKHQFLDIAEPSGMRLHLCDYHLEMARLRKDMGRLEEARKEMNLAKDIIAETGYHRRDKELAELQIALG